MNQKILRDITNRLDRLEIETQRLINGNKDQPNVTVTFNNNCRCSKCNALMTPSYSNKYSILFQNKVSIITCGFCL